MMPCEIGWLWMVLLCLGLHGSTDARGDLLAGVAKVDISPRQLPAIRNGGFLEQSDDHVVDPLHARCLALRSGSTTIVIAIVDSCMVPRDICDRIKESVSRTTGVPASHQLIAATHTHSAPSLMDYCLGSRQDPNYEPWFSEQVAAGMQKAVSRLRPAQIGWAVVDAPEHTHCRRWLKHPDFIDTDPFGDATVRAMMHPGYQNSKFVGPAGPVDSQLSLISVQTANGDPLCVLANYGMHYFGASDFSADYFGDFAREIESRLQRQSPEDDAEKFLAIMSQGTSGDQHWMDYSQPQRIGFTRQQYAQELAAIALEAVDKIEYRRDVPVVVAEAELTLKRRKPDEARLAWASEINRARGDQRPRNLPEVYAEQSQWLSNHPDANLLLQVIRIGDLGIAAIPNEVFGITGLKLKAQSPLQPLVNLELANGAEGYIPPPEQHALGGYTTWPARTAGLEVDAEPRIVEVILSLLEQVADGQPRKPVSGDFYNDRQRQAMGALLGSR